LVIVHVSPGDGQSQRTAPGLDQQTLLGTLFASIGRIGTNLFFPQTGLCLASHRRFAIPSQSHATPRTPSPTRPKCVPLRRDGTNVETSGESLHRRQTLWVNDSIGSPSASGK